MRVRGIVFDADELRPTYVGELAPAEDGPVMVNLGADAYAFVTEGQLFDLAEAWRNLYESVVAARHGQAAAWL